MTTRIRPIPGTDFESLFVLHGGRVRRALERAGLVQDSRLRSGRVAVILAVVTWLPLLILAIVEGVAWGERVEVPLLEDFLPYGQFLVALPVLVWGESIVAQILGRTVAELRRSDLLAPEENRELDALLTRFVLRWKGRSMNALLMLLTFAATGLSFWGVREWLSGGWQYVDERLTLPGWWYLLIGMTVLRFLELRWLWRFLLWAWFLSRVARLKLQPRPTHPDRAGGLAYLGATQAGFGVLVFALGVQLSCLVADGFSYQGADLLAFSTYLIAFVLITMVVLLLPLLVFAPKLVQAREEGLVYLSGSGYEGANELESKLRGRWTEDVSADEISGLADFGALYENARWTKPLPLEIRHVFAMVLSAVLPFLPLVFLVVPAQDVVRTLTSLLL